MQQLQPINKQLFIGASADRGGFSVANSEAREQREEKKNNP
jgi:hypothetical protein